MQGRWPELSSHMAQLRQQLPAVIRGGAGKKLTAAGRALSTMQVSNGQEIGLVSDDGVIVGSDQS